MKLIPLTDRPTKSAVVDDDDYSAVSRVAWLYDSKRKFAYSAMPLGGKVFLQDFVMEGRSPKGEKVRFKSTDRLDCRKCNLAYAGETPTRSIERGGDFEHDILKAGESYTVAGIAKIIKIEVPKATAKGKTVYREKTECDFIGWTSIIAGHGRIAKGLLIEAKDIDKTTLQILSDKEKGDGVKPHQLKALLNAVQSGADAFILWRTGGRVYRVDPRLAEERIGRSIHRDKDRLLLNSVPTKNGLIDFLYAL